MTVDRASMVVLSQRVNTTLTMPACIRAALIATEVGTPSNGNGSNGHGSNGNGSHGGLHGGPVSYQVTLKGGLIIGGLGVELIFGDRPRSVSSFPRDVTSKAVLLPPGQAVDIHGKSTRARVGGDPAAWMQIRDGDGVPLTDSFYLGRLGKGPCLMDPAFPCLVTAETYVSPVGISAPADSDLTLTGELMFDRGLSLRVVLRRREGPLWWGRRPDAVLDFEIVPAGHMIHFPAQPIWAGETVGALKSLIFLDGEGEPIGNEHLLKPMVGLQ
jgi:hypothetical protein